MRALLFAPLLTLAALSHAKGWQTDAEKSAYSTTPTYADSVAWLQRLDRAAPEIRLSVFGTTPEGRDMVLAVAAGDGEFTPSKARRSGKEIVLVLAGIHSGEIEGKDAGLALLRDLSVGAKHGKLLEHVIVLYVPVFNVDGHEQRSRHRRINQNGPQLRGTRDTAQRLNLNRDFVKADAPEMRALLKVFELWQPDLLIDIHTTDGADYQYDLTWFLEEWDNLHPAARAWQKSALLERVFPALGKRGHLLAPYLELIDHRDFAKGLINFGSGPRYSTGYAALRNRPGLLVETHMLKPYATRVQAAYDLLIEVLADLNAHPGALRRAVAEADAATIARAANDDARYALTLKTTKTPETFSVQGYADSRVDSDISGDRWVRYDDQRKSRFDVPFFRQLEVDINIRPPTAYLVPAAWASAVLERLDAHGIAYFRTEQPHTLRVSGERLSEPKWATAPFEGRIQLSSFSSTPRDFEAKVGRGAVVVPLAQANANIAIHLFEAQAPDSLLRWGTFNTIFERREYPDARVAESLARSMLAEDPKLKAEFEARLQDPEFAKNPDARLIFFFDRSAWAESELGAYPVLRIDANALRQLGAQHAVEE